MSRNRFLVTYDIRADKRRAKVYKVLLDHGDHVQYSVFVCELNEREFVQLRWKIRDRINHDEDQVLFVDLGPADRAAIERIESLGVPYRSPERVQIV
jgi:CRISPR-associated protein Cas2